MKTLESKLIALQLLYSCKLLIRGEQRPSSIARLIDYLKMAHGPSIVDKLVVLPFADLENSLGQYGVQLCYVPF